MYTIMAHPHMSLISHQHPLTRNSPLVTSAYYVGERFPTRTAKKKKHKSQDDKYRQKEERFCHTQRENAVLSRCLLLYDTMLYRKKENLRPASFVFPRCVSARALLAIHEYCI